MAVTGFLREDFKADDPVRKVASARQARRIARILNGLQGVGCRVSRDYSQEGYGWKIIVDDMLATVVTDTASYSPSKDPDGRETLERNPETYDEGDDSHTGKLQLRNVQLVKNGSKSVPFFLSEDALQGTNFDKVVGELYFATIDSDRYYTDDTEIIYRSIDVADTHNAVTGGSKGKWSLHLYGFTGCSVSHAPYAKATTNPAGEGRELEWRYPVTCANPTNQDPCNDTPVGNDCLSSVTTGSATGSYAELSFAARTLTVDRAALAISAEGGTQTAYVPVTLDYEDIEANIHHKDLDFTSDEGIAGLNSDHNENYLRRSQSWVVPGGETYSNICNGIAHAVDGTRGIDFANGLIYGDDATEGEKVDYGAQKLYAYESATKTETADWKERTLTAASTAAPWKATKAFRLVVDGDPTKWIDLVPSSSALDFKDQDGNVIGRLQLGAPV